MNKSSSLETLHNSILPWAVHVSCGHFELYASVGIGCRVEFLICIQMLGIKTTAGIMTRHLHTNLATLATPDILRPLICFVQTGINRINSVR